MSASASRRPTTPRASRKSPTASSSRARCSSWSRTGVAQKTSRLLSPVSGRPSTKRPPGVIISASMSDHSTRRRTTGSLWHWIPEYLFVTRKRPRRQIRLMLMSVLVGAATGIGAVIFYTATVVEVRVALGGGAGYWPEPHPGGEPHLSWPSIPHRELVPWLLLVIPAAGGLLSGLLVWKFAPEAEGHGTDAAIKAYHDKDGLIRPRGPIVKTIASALTIG